MNTKLFNPNRKGTQLSTLLAALFLIILGSGCRKETDEFRRRPLSNGKVFIQIGGRKWMIDDSFPSLFSEDNAGRIEIIGRSKLSFDTLNGKLHKVIRLSCESRLKNRSNVSGRLSLFFGEEGNEWALKKVYGYVSPNSTYSDSIYECSEIISGKIQTTNRLNLHTWHEGFMEFIGTPENKISNSKENIKIKFILKS